MTVTEDTETMTPAEYLVRERGAEYRSEYINGRMVLMTGGSRAHSLISGNIAGLLRDALRGSPCEAYQSDMRVRVAEGSFYTYPDVVVACEPIELEDLYKDTLLNPTVICEVLSPSTDRYDRGEKRRWYQGIASLRHYLVVAQDRPLVEHHRRNWDGDGDGNGDKGGWLVEIVEGLAGSVGLGAINVTLWLEAMYERVAEAW